MNEATINFSAKVGLAVALISILPLPIDFYFFTRIIIFFVATFIALRGYSKGYNIWVLFTAVALIFNPIFPVYLDSKPAWILLDIMAALLFFTQIKLENRKVFDGTFLRSESKHFSKIAGQKENAYVDPSVPLHESSVQKIFTGNQRRKLIVKGNELNNLELSNFSPEDFADILLQYVTPLVSLWQVKGVDQKNINSAYCKGFLFGFLGVLFLMQQRGRNLETEEKAQLSIRFMRRIDQALGVNFVEYLLDADLLKPLLLEKDFVQAQEHSVIFFRCILGLECDDLSMDIVARARRLSEMNNVDMPTSVFINTFWKYFETS